MWVLVVWNRDMHLLELDSQVPVEQPAKMKRDRNVDLYPDDSCAEMIDFDGLRSENRMLRKADNNYLAHRGRNVSIFSISMTYKESVDNMFMLVVKNKGDLHLSARAEMIKAAR